MNAHFPVVNMRGMITAICFTLLNIVLFSFSLAMQLGGGSRLWLIPIIIFAVFFLISIMILVSVLRAGIDVKDGTVIMPDLDPSKGKQPKFQIDELTEIHLENGDKKILNPYKDNLVGARFAFALQDGRQEIYYPVAVPPKQFEKVKTGMLTLKKEAYC